MTARSKTMAFRLLDAADLLLKEKPRSSAFRRRAVSTAYYAIFHALAKLCASYLTRSAKHSSNEYERVYRALEHRTLRSAFNQSPLKENQRLSEIGTVVAKLQTERHKADYLPPTLGLFSKGNAIDLVSQARVVVEELEKIKPAHKDCRTLATCLLFRERKL